MNEQVKDLSKEGPERIVSIDAGGSFYLLV
jgi:hypothetical protein